MEGNDSQTNEASRTNLPELTTTLRFGCIHLISLYTRYAVSTIRYTADKPNFAPNVRINGPRSAPENSLKISLIHRHAKFSKTVSTFLVSIL